MNRLSEPVRDTTELDTREPSMTAWAIVSTCKKMEKFAKTSIITKMESYKSQKKEKQSYENWDAEGSGRQFLLWNIKS